jgi:hypothetical protein
MLETLGYLLVPVDDHDTLSDKERKGDNPRVQAISREAVVGPSETIRPTP